MRPHTDTTFQVIYSTNEAQRQVHGLGVEGSGFPKLFESASVASGAL